MKHVNTKVLCCLAGLVLLMLAQASFGATQSLNVAVIPSPNVINGGTLPAVAGVTFTNMAPANVTDANLANYDTAVLNVAGSGGMSCNMNNLPAAGKTALINFVNAGKKLIIYDSECSSQNYSWLPFSFTTNNPGAMGAQGTLTIVEENTLSSNNPADPHYINAAYLSTNTDAVGDMNVMTTYNPAWCVDMSGTNINRVTGPVHTYAKVNSGGNEGLIIYNGLDTDYINYTAHLSNIYKFEILQPFNPSGLPCGVTVVGITLNPATATNTVGTSHTVTATLKDLLTVPQPNILVTFTILSGPNAGASGVCNPVSCRSDSNGNVSWTYTGVGGVGTDVIEATFVNAQAVTIHSQTVTKTWNPVQAGAGVDFKPLTCPNPFRTTEGIVPVALVGTLSFNVNKVDLATLRVEGLVPVRSQFKDASTPYPNPITLPSDCNAAGPDGIMDIVMFVDNQALLAKFPAAHAGDVLFVNVTGKLKAAYGGSSFNGADIVVLQ